MRPIVGQYIEKFGTKGSRDWLARTGSLGLIEKYSPPYLFYLNRAKKLRRYVKRSNAAFAENISARTRD
jgi:hypothetical protein